jgi:hypothetical protein
MNRTDIKGINNSVLLHISTTSFDLKGHHRVVLMNTVAYLLQARTVEPEKQSLLGNARKQQYMNCHNTRCDAYSR